MERVADQLERLYVDTRTIPSVLHDLAIRHSPQRPKYGCVRKENAPFDIHVCQFEAQVLHILLHATTVCCNGYPDFYQGDLQSDGVSDAPISLVGFWPFLHEVNFPGRRRIPTTGVYFLCHSDTVVYIGQTHQTWHRVSGHKFTGKWDRAYLMEVCTSRLNAWEMALVRKLEPELNQRIMDNRRETSYEMSFDEMALLSLL
jgi:hypothetical protein